MHLCICLWTCAHTFILQVCLNYSDRLVMSSCSDDEDGGRCSASLCSLTHARSRQHDDWTRCVRVRVQRACQSPFHSILREEATRSQSSVMEAYKRLHNRDKTHGTNELGQQGFFHRCAAWWPTMVQDGRSNLLVFAGDANLTSARVSRQDRRLVPESVTIVGDVHHHLSVYLAEEHLRRGISVTLLTSHELDKAITLYTSVAQHALVVARNRASRQTSASTQGWTPSVDMVDVTRDGRRVVRHAYRSADSDDDVGSYHHPVTLEIMEGEVTNSSDVHTAARHASVIYYMDPSATLSGRWGVRHGEMRMATHTVRRPWQCYRDSHSGFFHCLDACTRVDGHFVYFTPRWTDSSRLSLVHWYRRWFTHPMCYVATVRRQERALFDTGGAPSRRCYYYHHYGDDDDNTTNDGRLPRVSSSFGVGGSCFSWWTRAKEQLTNYACNSVMGARARDSRSETTLWPPELPPCRYRGSPVRFTSFRLSDVVYRSMNSHVMAAKNNNMNDIMNREYLPSGDLDVALVASVLLRCIGLCRVALYSRLDVSGTRRHDGVDMHDAISVKNLFDRQRNE